MFKPLNFQEQKSSPTYTGVFFGESPTNTVINAPLGLGPSSLTLSAFKSKQSDCPAKMASGGKMARKSLCTSSIRVVTGSRIAFVIPLNLEMGQKRSMKLRKLVLEFTKYEKHLQYPSKFNSADFIFEFS